MTTQEDYNHETAYMREKLKEVEYWQTEGYGRGNMKSDYSKIDRMTPSEIRAAYDELVNPRPDR